VQTNLLDLWIDFRKTAQYEGIDQGCFYLHTQNAPKPIRDDFCELFESLCREWEEQRLQRAADDALVDELLADDELYFPPAKEPPNPVEIQEIVADDPIVVSSYQEPPKKKRTYTAKKVRKSTQTKATLKMMCQHYLIHHAPNSSTAKQLRDIFAPKMSQKTFANYCEELYNEGLIDRKQSDYFRIAPDKTSWTWLYFAKE